MPISQIVTNSIANNVSVTFTAGSAAAPAVTTTGDTNTGMFFPAADTIAFAEGGAESMRLDSSGNLGIGTSTPAKRVHLFSSTAQSTVGASDLIRLAGQGTDNTVGNRLEVGFNYSNANRQNFATIGFVTTSTAGFCNGDLYFATRSVTTDTAPVEQARITSTGLFQFNSGYGSVATAFGCRAWVNFNGTGTVAIRASGNVSSITDNGTGDYTVNFSTAMPDANYGIGSCGQQNPGSFGAAVNIPSGTSPTTTALRILWLQGNGGNPQTDSALMSVAIFR